MQDSSSSPYVPCVCDPSVVWPDRDTSSWGDDCFEQGCTAYSALFFLIFLLPTAEGSRRIWMNRANYRNTVFISNFQLTFGCLLFTIRQIMMLAKVTEPISYAVLLTFGFSFFFSAYLFILMSWCEIIRSINFSIIIQRVFPIIRIVIISLNVILFAGFTVSVIIWWPYNVTNAFNSFYGFGVTLGFAIFGFIIYREFQKIKEANQASQRGRELSLRVHRVVMLSVCSAREMVGWLFVNRFALALFSYTMYICLKGSQGKKDEEVQKRLDAQWVKKNQENIFTNVSSNGNNNTFDSGEQFPDDFVYQPHQIIDTNGAHHTAAIGSLEFTDDSLTNITTPPQSPPKSIEFDAASSDIETSQSIVSSYLLNPESAMLSYYYPFYVTRTLRNLKNYVWWTDVVSPDQIHINWIQRVFNDYYKNRFGVEDFAKYYKIESFSVVGDNEDDAVTQGMTSKITRVKMVWKQLQDNNHAFIEPPSSAIMKSTHQSLNAYKVATNLNSQREALFYGRLSKQLLTDDVMRTLPEVYLSYAPAADKCNYVIFMEDLSGDKAESVSKLLGNQCWGDPKCSNRAIDSFEKREALQSIFLAMADLHSATWKNRDLLAYPTQELKFASWMRGENKEEWETGINHIAREWTKIKEEMPKSSIKWPQSIVKLFDNAIANSNWQRFRDTTSHPNFAYSLVHGDFHAGNMFWNINYQQQVNQGFIQHPSKIFIVDWSEIGIFCPFSELAQFIISNVNQSDRHQYEEELFRSYFDRLVENGVRNLDYSQCFQRYKMGGIERWIQFIVILKSKCNDHAMEWFIHQLSSFVEAHEDSIDLNSIHLLTSYPIQ
ncbi:hypothetical protein DFA_08515 [Cavenderia fasciculata]|uniref:CHK kinase-like domain-containing protein n=1 Tax=Cavenderia fasciculata TaxID=261658 RepID=F4Q2Q2_CACFS|nr:uncharacterized protein DFA_08515 [Cavenderia fasciculata]EGG17519.1 hypothetical protein DFA_08515 [Cavenderia fasciculata]|eukprot:XP_004356003.1 hypothetical protein DFA_08515 [Cavenderia fasciculata]